MPKETLNPVMEPATETSVAEETRTEPRYHLILFDDDEHSYEYVQEMMMNLFHMSADRGFKVAYEVDHIGQAVVKTCGHDEAVRGRDAIHSYGPDPAMIISTASMRAAVMEAE